MRINEKYKLIDCEKKVERFVKDLNENKDV
jgi:hypothetical protein